MTIHDENPNDEATDNAILRAVFDRQLRVSLLVDQITCLLYKARGEWIGGAMEFKDLTAAQKASYRAEVERLVKETGQWSAEDRDLRKLHGLPTLSQPQADGDSTDFDGRTAEEQEQQ